MRQAPPTARRNAGNPKELLLIAGVYLLAVIPFLVQHRLGREDVETDFFWEYAPYAARILHGDYPALFAYRGPGYHLLLALTGLLVPNLFWAGKILAALAGAAFVTLTALLARRFFGAKAAVVAAGLVAVQPQVLLYSWTVGTDMVFAALAALCLVLALRAGRPAALFAGLVGGCAFLTRPNGIFLLPAGVTMLLLMTKPARSKQALAQCGLFALAFALPFVVWLMVHHAIHHVWPASYAFRNLAAAASPGMSSLGTSVYQKTFETEATSFSEVLRTRGPFLLKAALVHLPQYLLFNAIYIWGALVAILMAIGGLLLRREKIARSAWSVPLAGLWLFLVLAPVYFEPRFFLFLSCPVAFLATAFFVRDGAWRDIGRPAVPPLVVLAVALVITAGQSLKTSFDALAHEKVMQPTFEAARVIRNLPDVPGAVAARKPHIAWWSGRALAAIPDVPLEELPAALRKTGAAFLYYGSVELKLLPQYRDLLTVSGVPRGLRLISVSTGPAFGALFQVLPENAAGESPIPANLTGAMTGLQNDLARRGITAEVGGQNALNEYNQGMFLVTRNKFAEAIPHLKAAVQARPDLGEASLFLGYALVETGQYPEGLKALDAARSLGQNTPELEFNRARALMGIGRLDEAAAAYIAYLKTPQASPAALYHLALIRSQQERNAEADSLFDRALAAGVPASAEFVVAHGQVLLREGRTEEAVQRLSAAAREFPMNVDVWLLLGYAYREENRTADARSAWRKVIEIDPNNEQALKYLKAR